VTEHPPSLAGAPLAGRYRLGDTLGVGATGVVYAAEDLRTGNQVAVKVLAHAPELRGTRLGREIRVLHTLRIPGVVRLLDEGLVGDLRYLVMERVLGAPFPGPRADGSWQSIADTVDLLLRTLAQVHEAKVVHRDLKPANVLVDTAGRPTVLDFGLARIAMAASTLSLAGGVLGTPLYQAPEQLTTDGVIDARADLYAVGVMLYEALAGRPPHPVHELSQIYSARLLRDAPPLASVAPNVPRAVARLVDRLLARAPADRPATARHALAALAELHPHVDGAALPWLGTRAPVAALLDACIAGRSVELVGPAGSGRTRCLRELDEELRARGRVRRWLEPGERPFESLAPLLGPSDIPEDPVPAAETTRAWLAAGGVLLVDDIERIDPATTELLATLRAAGPIVTARRGDTGDVVLAPLPADAIVPLFAGPEALVHLPRDGAGVVHARTGGNPARMVAELDAWVRSGGARWVDGLVLVTRAAIDTRALGPAPAEALALAPGGNPVDVPAVHRAIADRMPPGADGRLGHLLAAEAHDDAAEEARTVASRALADGHLRRARAAAAWGLVGARSAGDAAQARVLLGLLVTAALADGTREALEAGLHAAGDGDDPERCRSRLRDALAESAGIVPAGAEEASLPSRAGAPPEEASPRAQSRAERPNARGPAAAEAVVEFDTSLLAPSPVAPSRPRPGGDAPRWNLPRRLAAAGRHAEAAEAALGTLHDGLPPATRLSVLLDAATALLEARDLDAVTTLATEVRAAAVPRGLGLAEARATALLRAIDYRRGSASAPDLALVEGARVLGPPAAVLASICLTEAAVAWRTSRYEDGARLARMAADAAPDASPTNTLAYALAMVCEGRGTETACNAVLIRGDACGPAVALQARALVALFRPSGDPQALALAEALAQRLPHPDQVREVLSPAEALAFCRAGARRRSR
jgi:hypothetical protein